MHREKRLSQHSLGAVLLRHLWISESWVKWWVTRSISFLTTCAFVSLKLILPYLQMYFFCGRFDLFWSKTELEKPVWRNGTWTLTTMKSRSWSRKSMLLSRSETQNTQTSWRWGNLSYISRICRKSSQMQWWYYLLSTTLTLCFGFVTVVLFERYSFSHFRSDGFYMYLLVPH